MEAPGKPFASGHVSDVAEEPGSFSFIDTSHHDYVFATGLESDLLRQTNCLPNDVGSRRIKLFRKISLHLFGNT
jgi:hypothetical protein